MAEPNRPENIPPEQLDDIAVAAKEAGARAKSLTLFSRVAALEARLASIEPLIEQAQQNVSLTNAISDYVSDLRAEQSFMKASRWVVGMFVLIVLVALGWILLQAIYSPVSPLLKAPPTSIGVFIVGFISGIVVLLNGLVKGVFRTASERHGEGFLPPQLEAALAMWDRISGKPKS